MTKEEDATCFRQPFCEPLEVSTQSTRNESDTCLKQPSVPNKIDLVKSVYPLNLKFPKYGHTVHLWAKRKLTSSHNHL